MIAHTLGRGDEVPARRWAHLAVNAVLGTLDPAWQGQGHNEQDLQINSRAKEGSENVNERNLHMMALVLLGAGRTKARIMVMM